MNPEIQSKKNILKHFKISYLFKTESISYFILIPLLFLYIWTNLGLDKTNFILLLKCTLASVAVSMPTTYISNVIVLSPIQKYFNLYLNNKEISNDVYVTAQRRFFYLPYINGIAACIRWVLGLLMALVPFILMSKLSNIQTANIWIVVVVIPPFSMVLYFFLTELFMQDVLNNNIFTEIAVHSLNVRVTIVTRLMIVTLIIVTIPVVAIIGYFLLLYENFNAWVTLSYLKLGGIILFGLLVAFSLIFIMARSIRYKINVIIEFLKKVGDGDLTSPKQILAVMDELTRINQTVHFMEKNITEMILDINTISNQMERSETEVSQITRSFADDTQEQATTVEEVTATIEEMTAGMDNIAERARDQSKSLLSLLAKMDDLSGIIIEMKSKIGLTKNLTEDISSQTRKGEESLQRMSNSINEISDSSKQMTNIISMINDISDRINLLSLNASIEAARAGDAGRGFAVVAEEISKLADNTASSTKEIGSLIKKSESEIDIGMKIVQEVVEGISIITRGVDSINTMVTSISGFVMEQVQTNEIIGKEAGIVRMKSEEIEIATSEQKIAMNEVVVSVNRINDLTQSISAGSEEIAANAGENSDMAKTLKIKVSRFRLE